MKNENELNRMELILQEFAKLAEEKRTALDEAGDPNVEQLIREADALLRQRLDPMVHEAFRDHPEKLAEWESIMQEYYALDEEDPLDLNEKDSGKSI